jgi:hypothetical protein
MQTEFLWRSEPSTVRVACDQQGFWRFGDAQDSAQEWYGLDFAGNLSKNSAVSMQFELPLISDPVDCGAFVRRRFWLF